MTAEDPRPGERLRAAAAGVRSRAGQKLGDLRWWLLVRSGLAAALGVAALFWPGASLGALVGLVGLYCLLDGLGAVAAAVRGADAETAWPAAVAGLVAGGVLLFWPGLTVRIFLVAFGAWALFTGGSHVVAARRKASAEREATSAFGWVLAGLGGVLVLWPGTGVVTIAWVIALVAFAIAAVLFFVARRLGRLEERLADA